MKRTAQLKRGSCGWFAAGEGFEWALRELSDPAFKVFAYVCLRAERASGRLEFERAALASELASKGVCELEAAPNQHQGSRLRVRPEYWPYEGRAALARQPE